jgi:phosphoserine phosphatase RsbU/P
METVNSLNSRTNSTEEHTLSCMEVWGGNRSADLKVRTIGLDAFLHSKPHGSKNDVGGDVYYLSSCASGNITRVLLADVAGHGAEVASIAKDLRDLMRRNVNRISHTSILKELNQGFEQLTDIGDFATALVFSFFALTNKLTISNAGHPSPLIYHSSESTWSILDERIELRSEQLIDAPLGVEPATQYSNHTIPVGSGDMVLCFSDGVTEIMCEDNTLLGYDRLLGIVRKIPPDEPGEFVQALLRSLEDMAATSLNMAEDDLTIVVLSARPTGRTSALIRVLRAPGNYLRSRFSKNI